MKRSNRSKNLELYYSRRANEYEDIYIRPERQNDLRSLKSVIRSIFRERNVLEIACGTCYWTQVIAENARAIMATDISKELLNLAKSKNYHPCSVTFQETDAYSLENVGDNFSAGFCGFWWSHVPITKRTEFLEIFHSKLNPGALVVMIDNNYVEGSSTSISRRDKEGNTYQIRKLKDGTRYEVLKNFPEAEDLSKFFKEVGENIQITNLTYYWLLQYDLKNSP
jgi:ubiquinone/menaquinone biosynthesis C-methylase UbiE